jgi:hypothetical protein
MSFTLEVEFTGLCMFVLDAEPPEEEKCKEPEYAKSVTVVLPECRKDNSIGTMHEDEDPAYAHAGYLRFDLANLAGYEAKLPAGDEDGPLCEGIYRFSRQSLDFGLPEGGRVATKPNLPVVGCFASKLRVRKGLTTDADPKKLAVMRTRLTGGSLEGRDRHDWEIPRYFDGTMNTYGGKFADRVRWTRKNIEGSGLTLTIEDFKRKEKVQIPLLAVDKIIRLKVGNLCCVNPLEWDTLEDSCPVPPEPSKKPEPVEDKDFKWFYRLMLPEGETDYSKLLKKYKKFPAPKEAGGERGGQGCVGLTVYQPGG